MPAGPAIVGARPTACTMHRARQARAWCGRARIVAPCSATAVCVAAGRSPGALRALAKLAATRALARCPLPTYFSPSSPCAFSPPVRKSSAPSVSPHPPIGLRRRLRWGCSSAAAMRSMQLSPAVSCCRSWSRTWTARGEKSPFFYGTNRSGRPRRSADKAWRLRAPAQQRSSGWGWGKGPAIGLLPATVPGAFGAWLTMLRDHGTWSLAAVLEPALRYAREGFVLIPRAIQAILAVEDLFRRRWPTSAHVWLPDNQCPVPGQLFRFPALAATYEKIIAQAQDQGGGKRTGEIEAALAGWYRGFVARAIDDFCRTGKIPDSSGQAHSGFLRYDDMAHWQAAVEKPLQLDFGRHTLMKCGFWSQGPVFLQQAGMLRHAGLAHCAPDTAGFVHGIAEAAKLALADRLAWYGCAPDASHEAQMALL